MWDFMYICELLMAIPGKATNNNGIFCPMYPCRSDHVYTENMYRHEKRKTYQDGFLGNEKEAWK